MECSITNPALSLLMKYLVIGQRPKAPNRTEADQTGPYRTRLSGPCIAGYGVSRAKDWVSVACGTIMIIVTT